MTSSVRTFLPVVGDVTALGQVFAADPSRWLPASRRDGAADRWAVPVRGGGVTRVVAVAVGPPWRAGSTWWRSLSWEPAPEGVGAGAFDRLLPSFDGELGLHRVDDTHGTLILDGWYRPPGGALGSAADAVALRRVARSTMFGFLTDLAAQITSASVLSGGGVPADPRPDVTA